MGGRYLISGVQLGILLGMLRDYRNKREIKKLINKVIDEQFIFNSKGTLENDLKGIIKENEEKKKYSC